MPKQTVENDAQEPRFKVQTFTTFLNVFHPLWNNPPASSLGRNIVLTELQPAEMKHKLRNNSSLKVFEDS